MSYDKIEERMKKVESLLESATKKLDEGRAKGVSSTMPAPVSSGPRAGSDEARLLSKFHCRGFDQLLTVNTGDSKFKSATDEDRAIVRELKAQWDTARWMGQIFEGDEFDKGDLASDTPRIGRAKSLLTNNYAKQMDLAGKVKAFGSTVPGAGDEWVPTSISATYLEELELDRRLSAAYQSFSMPTNPWEVPYLSGYTTARLATEGGQATGSQFVTSKITFQASKFQEFFNIPEELNEDSAPQILQVGRAQIIASQSRAIEQAICQGDTTAPHMDLDVVAADDARKAWKGHRKLALEGGFTVDFAAGVVTKAKLDEMRALGGKWFVDPSRLAWVMSPAAYFQALAIPEVETLEKVGQLATVLKGALGAFRGSPIIVSEFIRQDLNAGGTYDGLTTDKTVVHLVNVDEFKLAQRRPLRMRVQPNPDASFDAWQLASYQRISFKPVEPTNPSGVLGINIQI